MSYEKEIAKILLSIGAVNLRTDPPFTWASGRLSPIYCDNRLIMSHPKHRRTVAEGFKSLFEKKGYRPEVIAGTATAGIPHAAWLADLLGLPMIYVRGQAKDHGKQNQVEGALNKGQTVVLIEDLISTGGSSIDAARGVIDAGATLLAVTSIFSYNLDTAKKKFEDAKIQFASLTGFEALIAEAGVMGILKQEELSILAAWREDPAAWSEARKAG
jgi:orotate phosphoribosyltransferase